MTLATAESGVTGLSDNELLRSYVSAGNRAALEELLRRYAPMVYAAARRQVRNAELAEDV